MRALLIIAILACVGCQCRPGLSGVEPGQLEVASATLDFAPTYVGYATTLSLRVSNVGRGPLAEDLTVTGGPFSAHVAHLALVSGESTSIDVTFAPTALGQTTGTLKLGSLGVALTGTGLEPLSCTASDVCHTATFDPNAAACVDATVVDGVTCTTRCISGACEAGTCAGQLIGCDDGDACTVDGCSETDGCTAEPKVCPASTAPCQVPTCDATTGCGFEQAADGTLCGVDDCLATQVDVCISGQCVRRTRPDTGRCANRWVPTSIPPRAHHGMAYDSLRRRVVLFGGSPGTFTSGTLNDTWEWDGTWHQKQPATAPSPRRAHAMVYDSSRQRVVLFGGYSQPLSGMNETWEWDGTTWVQRVTSVAPAGRYSHAMTYDSARRRTVLFGGRSVAGAHNDTWEWDGTRWTQLTPPTSPSPTEAHVMAYDSARRRVVPSFSSQATWEWDGTTWTRRAPESGGTPAHWASMTYDERLRQVVLLTGYDGTGVTSTWNGTTWTAQSPAVSPDARYGAALVYDRVRQRAVLFGGVDVDRAFDDTWLWDGATWAHQAQPAAPPSRRSLAMAYDTARQRVVLFGGRVSLSGAVLSDTWEWNGADWAERTPAASPPPRDNPELAYDAARQRVVLFGGTAAAGSGAPLDDTWEWDGTQWTRAMPSTSPLAREGHALAYDRTRQRVVLFGGTRDNAYLSDTWEWDGATWTQRTPTFSPTARAWHTLAFDSVQDGLVLFGGVIGGVTRDTLLWNGTTWAVLSPPTAPTARHTHTMAAGAGSRRGLLYGGYRNDETWEWTGTTWLRLTPVTAPPDRNTNPRVVYDEARQRMTLFDGATTWVLLP